MRSFRSSVRYTGTTESSGILGCLHKKRPKMPKEVKVSNEVIMAESSDVVKNTKGKFYLWRQFYPRACKVLSPSLSLSQACFYCLMFLSFSLSVSLLSVYTEEKREKLAVVCILIKFNLALCSLSF